MTVRENHTLATSIAREHGQSLRRFVASRVRRARGAIDDIVQEVYLRIIRRGEQETVRNPEAYVIQVAAHTLYDLGFGKGQPHGEMPDAYVGAEPDLSADDPIAAADAQLQLERVERILGELPPRVRASFLLYRVHGLSHDRIARELGVHPNTVKNDIKAATSHLGRRAGTEAE